MIQADNNEKEDHLMCVICEFEDNYLVYKIFVERSKGDWNFRISDLVKNPDGTDI